MTCASPTYSINITTNSTRRTFSRAAPVVSLRASCSTHQPASISRARYASPAANTLGASEIHTICRRGVLVRASSTTEVDGVSQTEVAPSVIIDNLADPLATVVVIEFGDLLGDLLDTMSALRGLGLNISKAALTAGQKKSNRFYVTDAKTSEKVTSSERLEEIKSVILNTMMEFHPEARSYLAAGRRTRKKKERGPLEPREEPAIPTSIKIWKDPSGARSRLDIVTTDRSGLLVDIVRILKDISVNVVSAEIDTIGIMAHDVFFLTYKGEALTEPMEELVKNALYYYLVLAEVEREESY
eukprot:CAMPEP_0114228446 /NCGR_PEP_ID=MMETSP0058-20121206/2349_1 /TAXON_ID=36894 /ORGANISM="Pyramimonas parkeae, CCMP726" /LENGTH=299 /DNA_ID=CAMNT_0001339397 /DNA_START=3999 /DNA_END=4898 /DNA_ORIENTATION=-